MSKLKTAGGAVALALVLFGMSGGAEADATVPASLATGDPSDDVWELVVYSDDPVAGAAECAERVVEYAPAVCSVEPTSAAPDIDLSDPNWIDEFAPSWAGGSA
jgi:hypothetical protein